MCIAVADIKAFTLLVMPLLIIVLLYEAYIDFCSDNFLTPMSETKFGKDFAVRGYKRGKAIEILKKHKEEQEKQKEIVGAAWQHPELVFTSCTGHWYDRSLLNAQFRRFVKKHREELNLEHNLTIHGLRHTNAALLLFAGEDIENISAHLGHASADITSRVYAHM